MSTREGIQQDLDELLKRLGDEPVLREAEALGLSPKGRRMRCPWPGCQDKGPERDRDAVLTGAHPRLFCHACQGVGDLVDLLQLSRGLSKAEAIAHLSGVPVPARPPVQLRVVGTDLGEDPDKLSPAEVRRIWDGLALEDELGQAYLEKRGLGDALEHGLVRFATEKHPDKGLRGMAKRGYRVAVLQTDVVGNPRGIQLRNVGQLRADAPKILSVKGSAPKKGFFGAPELIESSAVVCVAEGLADTLAVAIWADARPGLAVVGASGMNFLANLADELAGAGVPLAGKIFGLFVQNDAPKNKSRKEFLRLAQKLKPLGAEIALIAVDREFKDVADWRQRNGDADWPPPELARALFADTEEAPAAAPTVLPAESAIPIPREIRAELFAQNFSTLCTLLDDPLHREPIMGRGEVAWCQMRQGALFNGRPITDADVLAIRLGIESQSRSTDGKALKFSTQEIEQALHLVAHKNPIHPVRDWLSGLGWDGTPRLRELGPLMGHPLGQIEGVLLARWIISAVARALEPGCKADCALVLVGEQSAHKTTFLETLGGDWYSGEAVAPGDKDGKQIMGGAWIIEWGELSAIRKTDVEAVKHFLSQRIDMYRPPYGRRPIRAPRGCVIAGTSNPKDYLSDPTGNRRFWTVQVRHEIDLAWVRTNRDQLFAEATAIYRAAATCLACKPTFPAERCADHRWWLTKEEEVELAALNKEHEKHHPWSELVGDWLESDLFRNQVTAAQVLIEGLHKPEHQITAADEQAVGRVMRGLGWEKKRRLVGGRDRWVYVRPE